MKGMRIKHYIERIPGGMMVVPLFIGALINSLYPQILEIGGFTTGIAKGAVPLIGAFLFCMGSGIRFKSAPKALKKGLSVTLSKFIIGTLIGLAVGSFFGEEGFLGLSSLAIISAMTNTNGGLYAALVGEYGDETDVGAIAIISINDGPFLTMLAVGASGLATFPLATFLGVILPVLLGMVLGNLDSEIRTYLLKGGMVLIPIFSFSLGCGIDLGGILDGGFSGLLLGAMTVIVGGFFNIMADRISGGTGICGAAASSTAGNAVATPMAIALADPQLAPLVGLATSQVAAACIASVVLTPLLTNLVHKYQVQKK